MYYLDAVNKAAVKLTTRKNERGTTCIQQFWGSTDRYWVSTGSRGQKDDDFLTLAVRCDLIEYLRAKFEEAPPTRQPASKLLETEISLARCTFRSSLRSERRESRRTRSEKMVAIAHPKAAEIQISPFTRDA